MGRSWLKDRGYVELFHFRRAGNTIVARGGGSCPALPADAVQQMRPGRLEPPGMGDARQDHLAGPGRPAQAVEKGRGQKGRTDPIVAAADVDLGQAGHGQGCRHALVGGLIGAAIAYGGWDAPSYGSIAYKILLPLVLSPLAGFSSGYFLMVLLSWMVRTATPGRVNFLFRKLQILSSAFMSW